MPNRINTKNRRGKAVDFGGLQTKSFPAVALTASSTNTIIYGRALFPFAFKAPMVMVLADTAANGVTSFNVSVGVGTPVGGLLADNSDTAGNPQVNTVSGVSLFGAAGQAVTLAANVGQSFVSSEPDAIFPKNTQLTVRIVTGAAVAGNFYLALGIVPVDIFPLRPESSNTGFTWAGIG